MKRILISGAGIAGPSLAWALKGRGHEVTVVERAPALREGGQAVDFRGPIHREVLDRLGLWERIRERRTRGLDLVLLGRDGREKVKLPSVMMSGDLEIVRGDLTRLLYELTRDEAEYRFGVTLTALSADGRAHLSDGSSGAWDLVVGADGLHSNVRALVFGDEERHVRHHGYRLGVFSLKNVLGLEGRGVTYTEPGRSLMVSSPGGDRASAQLVFAGPPLGRERLDLRAMRAVLRAAYASNGWETARVLAELDAADDLYVDQIATVRVDRYASGRVVLLGDAAWGGTLGGQGTPLAIVGAWVLANELGGDVATALERYEARMRPYASECQKGAERVGSFFAPRTRFGLWCRDLFYRAFTSRLLIGQFEKMVKASATSFELPAASS